MDDYNTLNENKQISKDNKPKKKVGFNRFVYYNINKKEGYSMNITEYETNIRKQIVKLKAEKKDALSEKEKDKVEKEIARLKGGLISNTDNAVFNYLMANIQSNNEVNMNKIKKTQSAIAEELFLNRQTVSTSFNKLKRLHIISYKIEGNAFDWIKISPYICWQGEANAHYYKINEQKEVFLKRPFEVSMNSLQ